MSSGGTRPGCVVVFFSLALAGCPASHGPYPDVSCTSDVDCFTQQGEHCVNRVCVATPIEGGNREVRTDSRAVDRTPSRDQAPKPDHSLPDTLPRPDASPPPDSTRPDLSAPDTQRDVKGKS